MSPLEIKSIIIIILFYYLWLFAQSCLLFHIWAASWQNLQNDLYTQQRLRSAWASAQFDQSLPCSPEESLGPKLPTECTPKSLISPGWSESSLGTQIILLVSSWGSSYCVCKQRRLRFAGLFEPSLFTYVISTFFTLASSKVEYIPLQFYCPSRLFHSYWVIETNLVDEVLYICFNSISVIPEVQNAGRVIVVFSTQ